MSRILPPPKKKDNDDSANRVADDLSVLLGDGGVSENAEEAEEPEPALPQESESGQPWRDRRRGLRRAAPAASRSISTASNSGSAHGNSKDGIPKYIDAFTYHDGTPIVCLACKKEKQRPDPAFPEEKIWWKFHGSEDDPHNHSAFDGYCDHIWTPNNSNSNKSNFRVTVAVTVTPTSGCLARTGAW